MTLAHRSSRPIHLGEEHYRWTVTEAARGAGRDLVVIIESQDRARRAQLRAELPSAERRRGDIVTPAVVREVITAAQQAGWTPDGSKRDVFVFQDLADLVSVRGHAVTCSQCERLLTPALEPVRPPSVLDYEDGHATVPPSHFTISDGDYFPEGWMVINSGDMRNVRRLSEGEEHYSCCSSERREGLGRQCLCGAQIGLEFAACWRPHGLALAPWTTIFGEIPGRL